MAVKADISIKGFTATSAYVRLMRVWGGKDENEWVGKFQIFASEAKAYPNGRGTTEAPIAPTRDFAEEINVRADYANSDPRPLVFAALKDTLAADYAGANIEDV